MASVYEIISKKRDGFSLNYQELHYIIHQYTAGYIPDYQMSALLMAIYLRGMSEQELIHLTEIILKSGKVVNLDHLKGSKVDKHSTGGVGDKVSIILAPIVAAAGVYVPMISGRGLGHTGGTLDKLESIPGFQINYSIQEFLKILSKTRACLIGQTSELAPADKKIYALRDVTATVQSIPLIAASIMSKKIAEGIDALVLDVKTGIGAFMSDYSRAVELAKTLIGLGEASGKTTAAYITDMSNPIGKTVGNWLEILECIECLHDNGPQDLMEVTHRLSGTMIYLGKKAVSIDEGVEMSQQIVESGKAWQKFVEIVSAQNGDIDLLENPDKYPPSEFQLDYICSKSGWIESIDAFAIGMLASQLGSGRQKSDDHIDPKAGIHFYYKAGEKIEAGTRICTLYTDHKQDHSDFLQTAEKAIRISKKPASAPRMILDYFDKSNI